jgi:hypothetical protein
MSAHSNELNIFRQDERNLAADAKRHDRNAFLEELEKDYPALSKAYQDRLLQQAIPQMRGLGLTSSEIGAEVSKCALLQDETKLFKEANNQQAFTRDLKTELADRRLLPNDQDALLMYAYPYLKGFGLSGDEIEKQFGIKIKEPPLPGFSTPI